MPSKESRFTETTRSPTATAAVGTSADFTPPPSRRSARSWMGSLPASVASFVVPSGMATVIAFVRHEVTRRENPVAADEHAAARCTARVPGRP